MWQAQWLTFMNNKLHWFLAHGHVAIVSTQAFVQNSFALLSIIFVFMITCMSIWQLKATDKITLNPLTIATNEFINPNCKHYNDGCD